MIHFDTCDDDDDEEFTSGYPDYQYRNMFLADTIDGLESSAVRKDEKTETIIMMGAEVKFQDSGSPSEEDLEWSGDFPTL